MLWGGNNRERMIQKIQDYILPEIESSTVKRLLAFNEPDSTNQSNMNVSTALDSWPILESLGIPLISPSCVHADGVWMRDFMEATDQTCLGVDWIGVHWYGGTNPTGFMSQMRKVYKMHGRRPLMITEFAPADWTAATVEDNKYSEHDVLEFMKAVLPWLERQDWIAGYAWFSFKMTNPAGTTSALFDEDGNMTALGRYYASVRTENPDGDLNITVNG